MPEWHDSIPACCTGDRALARPTTANPDRDAQPSSEPAAVTLFKARARAANAKLALSHDQIPLVAQICRRLDGLPLAIELVAAWVRSLPLPTILAYLQSTPTIASLPLLAGGPRDRPAHQQALQATLAWSYNLLTPQAQRISADAQARLGSAAYAAAYAEGRAMALDDAVALALQ